MNWRTELPYNDAVYQIERYKANIAAGEFNKAEEIL